MANVQHSSLPDAELHEPKGVVDASSGEVYVADGSASGVWTALVDMDLPKDVTGTDGYVKLPGGVILQWGKANTASSGGITSVTFPIAFPNACLNVTSSRIVVTTGTGNAYLVRSYSTTGAQWGTANNEQFLWSAIGY